MFGGGGGGGTKTWVGGRLRSRDQTNSECGSNLVNILLQILCYPSLQLVDRSKNSSRKDGISHKIGDHKHQFRRKDLGAVADLGGGDGGMHPPHQPKRNDFGPKNQPLFRLIRYPFRAASPPTSLNLTISAEKSLSISVKTFFFFFFFLETT